MRISIITISFNQGRYLNQLFDSLVGQMGVGDEHIVIDPGSTDDSRDIIKKRAQADSRIKYYFEPDGGPADGLNKGFSHAVGDIFYYINSDDYLLPNSLDFVRNKFISNLAMDVLIGSIKIQDNVGLISRRGRVSDVPSVLRLRAFCFQYYQQGTFFRSSVFRATGGFNVVNRTCWDYELIVDMALKGARFSVISRPLAVFRLHTHSITGSSNNAERYAGDMARILNKVRCAGLASTPNWLTAFLRVEARFNPVRIIKQFRAI